ncbi:MAG: calcium/sodium antiporter [Eubacteriales bacterium]
MEELIFHLASQASTFVLLLVIAVTLFTLSKGADILVDEAVSLSVHWGVPKTIIGATIVSLGTTLPEVSVSVLAAINGNADLALGNAIGSIIVDTGLILGIAAIIGNLPVDKTTFNRQGKVQILAAVLLTFISLPIFHDGKNGIIPQWMGWIFMLLLFLYIFISIQWAKKDCLTQDNTLFQEEKKPVLIQLIKLFLGIALVIISSKILIPAVEITAGRIGVPQSVIAATLVAFGTSLPELITAVTAVRKGHGELAVGNIIGADILNVLFVIGSAASVTSKGLTVPANYYLLQYPTMIIILFSFRYFAKNSGGKSINRLEGFWLVGIYSVYLLLNYL